MGFQKIKKLLYSQKKQLPESVESLQSERESLPAIHQVKD
jgi:hypothetical protein